MTVQARARRRQARTRTPAASEGGFQGRYPGLRSAPMREMRIGAETLAFPRRSAVAAGLFKEALA